MTFKWNGLAFASKKPLRELNATFIVAPREISQKRFTQIVRQYLPQGHVVLGISSESHVLGFENQPQFQMLDINTVQPVIDKVNGSGLPYQVHILEYSQKDLQYIFEKVTFAQVLLVNGSWKYSFHTQAPFYSLVQSGAPYQYISAFCDEQEAIDYEKSKRDQLIRPTATIGQTYTESELLQIANDAAKSSYDYSFQTGAVLAKKKLGKYQLMAWQFNKVVPYQTYALLNGSSREQHFSPAGDLNHYDTVHAETLLAVGSNQLHMDMKGSSLFINLLPCPTCARLLSQLPISEVVYVQDHSDGYAVKILETSGKKVRRLVL
jgi:deoxycytidylate deaminase